MSWRRRLDEAQARAQRARTLIEVEMQRQLAARGVDHPEQALGRVGDQVRIQTRSVREGVSQRLRERGYSIPAAKPLILRDGTVYLPKTDQD